MEYDRSFQSLVLNQDIPQILPNWRCILEYVGTMQEVEERMTSLLSQIAADTRCFPISVQLISDKRITLRSRKRLWDHWAEFDCYGNSTQNEGDTHSGMWGNLFGSVLVKGCMIHRGLQKRYSRRFLAIDLVKTPV